MKEMDLDWSCQQSIFIYGNRHLHPNALLQMQYGEVRWAFGTITIGVVTVVIDIKN